MNPSTAETVRARSMSSPPALILSSPTGRRLLGLLIFIVLFTKLENERSISSDFILCLFPWDLTSPPQWMVHYAMNGTLRCKVLHDFLALLEQQNPNCDIFWISIFFFICADFTMQHIQNVLSKTIKVSYEWRLWNNWSLCIKVSSQWFIYWIC